MNNRYDIPPIMQIDRADPPEPAPLKAEAFTAQFNLRDGEQAALMDYDGFYILFSSAVFDNTRKSSQPFWNRLVESLEAPDEVWMQLTKEGNAVYSYLKWYRDGLYLVRVQNGEALFWVLKDDLAWMERQRDGFLIYQGY